MCVCVCAHLVLRIASGLEEWRTHADHIVHGHIRKVTKNFTHANHLAHPLLVALVLQSQLLRDALGGNLVSGIAQMLDLLIVAARKRGSAREQSN